MFLVSFCLVGWLVVVVVVDFIFFFQRMEPAIQLRSLPDIANKH